MNSTKRDSFLNVRTDFWICLFLVLVTLGIYFQVGTFEFINYDTPTYVYENRYVKDGLTANGIKWAFTTLHFSNWHPLTWLSHMLDVQLYGLEPGRHHLTSVLLHVANILLLFGILRRMTGDVWRCSIVAVLFALHPLHVQSVAWVAERKDVLSTLFGLLTLVFYLRYVTYRGIGRYLLMLLFFILGLMAKPMIVTLPFVMILLDYWPLQRYPFQIVNKVNNADRSSDTIFFLITEKIPLIVLSAGSSLVTLIAQKVGGAVGSIETFPFNLRMANALTAYMSYILKLFWPVNLAAIYPYNWELPAWQVWAACFFITGISWISIKWYQSRPWFLVGWLWYLGTLVPVIGLVQVGTQAMADRYTYIPLIGIYIIIAWGLFDLLARWRYRKVALVTIAVALISVLMVVSWKQIGYWKNTVTLLKRAVELTGANYKAYNNIGQGLLMTGKTGEAIKHFKMALEINPRSAIAHFNLGLAFSEQGRLNEAFESCAEAVRIKPNFAEAHYCQGKAQLRLGKPDQAVLNYQQAIKIDSTHVEVYNNLGNALFRLGKHDKAIASYKQAITIDPTYAQAYKSLGEFWYHTDQAEKALPNFMQAIKINPQFAEAYNGAGAALIRMGEAQKATAFFREAVKIDPDYVAAQNNLKNTLATLGKNK
jgi:tetratricopeptide (TPR) repeat protein